MKLFVVGTDKPNPEDWKAWDEVELVIAETPKEAVEMCGLYWGSDDDHAPVAEVDMTIARRVIRMPDYVEDY